MENCKNMVIVQSDDADIIHTCFLDAFNKLIFGEYSFKKESFAKLYTSSAIITSDKLNMVKESNGNITIVASTLKNKLLQINYSSGQFKESIVGAIIPITYKLNIMVSGELTLQS